MDTRYNEKFRAEENSQFIALSNMKLGDESSATMSIIINRNTLKYAGFVNVMTVDRAGKIHVQQFKSEGVCIKDDN